MTPAVLLAAAAALALAILLSRPVRARFQLSIRPLAQAIDRFGGGPPSWSSRRRLAVLGGVAAVAAATTWATGRWWLALVPFVVAVGVVLFGPRILESRRRTRLASQLGPAAELLGASCEVGLSLRAALVGASRDLDDPIAEELVTVREALDLGGRLDDALRDFAERIGTSDARLFSSVVAVRLRSGGDLGRSLRSLGERMARRQRLGRELRGMTAQARSTALIVVALPVVAAVGAELAAPGAISGLLAHRAGLAVVVASVTIQAFGLLLVRVVSRVHA